jgi:hypothetical protein
LPKKKVIALTLIIKIKIVVKLLTYSPGIEKLKRRKKARNKETEQINRSILKIIHAGVVDLNERTIRYTKE